MIDIIVPTHDRPGYLDEALASIRAAVPQAGIIVVDDASETTEAEKVATRHAATYLRHEVNTGIAQTLVDGWNASTAEWTVFFGDDDVMLPNWKREIVPLVRQADVVSTSYHLTDGDLAITQTCVLPPVTLADLRNNIVTANDGSLLRRSVVERVGFHPENGRAMMLTLWLDLMLAGARFATVAEPCWLYRRHRQNLSQPWGWLDPDFIAQRLAVIASR